MANSVPLDEQTAQKVIRQVEFYFSDSNLPRDCFLRQSIRDSKGGLVSLALICSFSRMRSHLSLGDVDAEDIPTETIKAVAETLRASSLLQVSEDGERVGRIKALSNPKEVIEQLDAKTIVASPLPYDVSIEDVESFFGQYGKVNSVRLPRHVSSKKYFSGSALIEFSSKEDAKKVLKQSLVYAGAKLELKPKKDPDVEGTKKEEEEEEEEEEEAVISHQHDSKNKKNAIPQERYTKGLIIAFKLKRITADGASNKNGSDEPAAASADVAAEMEEQKPSKDVKTENTITDGDEGKEVQKDGVDVAEQEPSKDVKTENTITDGDEGKEVQKDGVDVAEQKPSKDVQGEKVSADGADTETAKSHDMDVVLREDLKSVFKKFGNVKYVDFKKGSDSGYIRFENAEGSQKARAAAVLANEGGLIVKNYVANLDPLQGEAEEEYWNQILNKKYNPDNNMNRGRNKRPHFGHGGGGGHRKKNRS